MTETLSFTHLLSTHLGVISLYLSILFQRVGQLQSCIFPPLHCTIVVLNRHDLELTEKKKKIGMCMVIANRKNPEKQLNYKVSKCVLSREGR